MASRPRILLLIPHLGGGGAERVTELLAQNLPGDRYELHLGLITGMAGDSALPEGITVHALGARRVRRGAWALLRLVWAVRPAVILSGMAHLNFLVLLLRPLFPSGTGVVVRQNGTVSAMLGTGRRAVVGRLLYRALYARADCVICQSATMAQDLREEARVPRSRMAVLPNPVAIDAIRAAASRGACMWRGKGPRLLAVGRLAPEKGLDLLLEAFAAIRREHASAELVLVGCGQEEARLRALCSELGLDDAVRLVGAVAQPAEYFRGATLFVNASRHEGMPNALLEAAAGGLPIVALPASGGMVELLAAKQGVWLGDAISAEALARALKAALAALEPGERFQHGWIESYRLEHAIARYEELIDAVLAARRR